LAAELPTAKETSIAVPGERAFLMIVREKADFPATVPGPAVFPVTAPGRVAFQRIAREKAGFRATARGKEALARNGRLTKNREQDLADSVTGTSLFSVTGKVPGNKQFSGR
jgi:hypothetical protein